jgi:hypothetical protein
MEISMNVPWRAAAFAVLIGCGMASPVLAQSSPPAANSETKDPFGLEVTLTPKTIIFMKGNSTWDKALENLQDAFKSVYALVERQGLVRAGSPMTIYTQADDTGFSYQAAVPLAAAPRTRPRATSRSASRPAARH